MTPIDDAVFLALLDLLTFGAIFVIVLNTMLWLNHVRAFLYDSKQQEYLQ
jgi:hypothetical protein